MAKSATKRRSKATRTKSARKPATARRKIARKAAPSAKRKPARKQRFVVSHHNEDDFETGLRSYAKYRDLGIAQATGGLVQAHVIRFVPPCEPEEVAKLHYHDVEFQMVYVLKGWIRTELEGQGAHTMRAGSSWIQPPKVEHRVLDYSDDCEVLEIILPAEFDTVMLE